MILVDIYVPAFDKNYNFSLNEDIDIDTIIAEVTGMIAQKEQTYLKGDIKDLNLFLIDSGRVLPKRNTLLDLKVIQGSSLMLV